MSKVLTLDDLGDIKPIRIIVEATGERNIQLFNDLQDGIPAKNVPPRPVEEIFSSELIDNYNEIMSILSSNVWNVSSKDLGQFFLEQVTEIMTNKTVPNAPYTEMKKGFNLPFVETGELFNSLKYRIEELEWE